MTHPTSIRILRSQRRLAYSALSMLAMILWGQIAFAPSADGQSIVVDKETEMTSFIWDFSRHDDPSFTRFPSGWMKYRGIGFPSYVTSEIAPRDPELEQNLLSIDTQIARVWGQTRDAILHSQDLIEQRFGHPPALIPLRNATDLMPTLMPSITDMLVDRYFRVDLDGGQFTAESPTLPASRRYQYRFSCQILTRGLEHDSAFAELEFLDQEGRVLETYATEPVSGTRDWATLSIPAVQPPFGATQMLVRLRVLHSEDGLEDIRGSIGFDQIRIDQHPQLAVATDRPLGIYRNGERVTASAKVMGLPKGTSDIQFTLVDHRGKEVATSSQTVEIDPSETNSTTSNDSIGTEVSWKLPVLGPGFYRVSAFVEGSRISTLASDTTFAIIDQLVSGPPHGCFGWSLPGGRQSVPPQDLSPWLSDFGVAWLKYPCWLAPEDTDAAEETAMIFSQLQDEGIETIGMLDKPPEHQRQQYEVRGRRDLAAAFLFRNETIWQPLLEPVMTRMTLKVRRWQLGADRDHSFLGRARLNDAVAQISTSLQGYGQPIDVALSWPWEELQPQDGPSSWQAECRSSDPPLGARELDAYLSMRSIDRRPGAPRTWLLVDPISSQRYSQTTRVQDLIHRMATVRSHRVQAAFVSNPRDPNHGLLRRDGRPDELLLPWRTTARLIGNLRKTGSLQMRHGTKNMVFAGDDRAVLLLWAAAPVEEQLFLGNDAQVVDAWGRVSELPVQFDGNRPYQTVRVGQEPIFIVGADPNLLAFRMAVRVDPSRLDSLIGQEQKLSVSLTNPLQESLVGDIKIAAPNSWTVDQPKQSWQALADRTENLTFKVALTNVAMIGDYEIPIHFDLDTIPTKRITVYRHVSVGPEGIDIDAKTKMLSRNELQVQIELTNRTNQAKSFECLLFPPPGRQFQERLITVAPNSTIRRDFFWRDAKMFLGREMTLRAVEQDGPRVINFRFKIRG